MAKRKKRRRVGREAVRKNAEKGSRKGFEFIELPEGVDRWIPEKATRFNLDIVPFEVTSKDHPDDVEKGVLWYKMPFSVHHGIGVSDKSVVCPRSVGKRCPICEGSSTLKRAVPSPKGKGCDHRGS